jgi:hypothetical protein
MAVWKGEFDMSFSAEPKRPATAASKKAALEASKQELKGRVTRSLQKLSDRDTQQGAIDELVKISKELKPEHTSTLLSSVCDFEDGKSAFARAQASRLFSVIVQSQFSAAQGHLGKIIATLSKRMRDLDSSVRESCAETIGELARLVCSQETGSSHGDDLDLDLSVMSTSMLVDDKGPTLEVFFRPLFQGMSSADNNTQQGCALAIAHVFFKAGKRIEPHLEGVSKKILSLLDHPQFSAKCQLLTAVANVIEVFPEGFSPLVRYFMPRIANAALSTDWNTRKHAMETVETMAARLDPSLLYTFKQDISAMVEKNKYDKVKPVRDAALQAAQVLTQNFVLDREEDTKHVDRMITPRSNPETRAAPSNDENDPSHGRVAGTYATAPTTPPRNPMHPLQSTFNARIPIKVDSSFDQKGPLTTGALCSDPAAPNLACSQLTADSVPSKETWDKLLKHFDRMTLQQTQLIEMVSAFSESVRERLETVEQKVFALELRQASVEQRQSLPGMPPTPSRAVFLGVAGTPAAGGGGSALPRRLNPLTEAEEAAAVDSDFRP